jgi:hypothetical protein
MAFPGGAVFLRLDAGKFDGLAAVVELGAVFRCFGDTGPPGLELIQGVIRGENAAPGIDHDCKTIWLTIG